MTDASPIRGMDEPSVLADDGGDMFSPDERNPVDAFAANAIRIANEHAAATARAQDENANTLDAMRLAGFVFESDNRTTVADVIRAGR